MNKDDAPPTERMGDRGPFRLEVVYMREGFFAVATPPGTECPSCRKVYEGPHHRQLHESDVPELKGRRAEVYYRRQVGAKEPAGPAEELRAWLKTHKGASSVDTIADYRREVP